MGTLFAIAYTKAALASVRKIESKKVRRQIVSKIESLADNPKPQGCTKVQGMSNGNTEVYRIRSGDYRALYTVRGDSEVLVLDIGHRKDVYRNQVGSYDVKRHHDPKARMRINLPFEDAIERALSTPPEPEAPRKRRTRPATKRMSRRVAAHR